MAHKVSIHTDGGSRGNPGPAGAGVVVRDMETGQTVFEAGYFLGRATNNVAEYQGLIHGIEAAIKLGAREVHFHSDSELMVKQILGEYRVKSADLQPLVEEAQGLLLKLDLWRIKHVPRAQNSRADELANKAMDAGRDFLPHSPPRVNGTHQQSAATKPAGEQAPAQATQPAERWTVTLQKSPGDACPARCPGRTPFHFGPATPAGFCVHAAQAFFSEEPTLWREAGRDHAQTHCSRCGVSIHISLD